MQLPPAQPTFDQSNENEARFLTQIAINGLEARVSALEAAPGGVTPPPPPILAPIPVGVWDGFTQIGKGPGGDTVGNRWGVVHGIPATNGADIPTLLTQADAAGVHLIFNLVHSPSQYTDVNGSCQVFNEAKYIAWLDLAATFPALATALAAKKASVLVFDEPLASYYCNSITRKKVNEMGRATKDRFPGAICMVRAGTNVFSAKDAPSGGWSAIDYGMPQYGRFPVGSTLSGELPRAYFTRQLTALSDPAVNMGIIPGINLWDGGGSDYTCWDYLNTGSSSGRIHGSITTNNLPGVAAGSGEPCATPGVGRYMMSWPALIQETVDAVFNHPNVADFPLFMMWNYTLSGPQPLATYQAYMNRSDFVTKHDYAITTLAGRTVSNGWRTIKP